MSVDSPADPRGVTTIVVMGVAGAGKTTVGRALAARLGWRFIDADELHPSANVEKMRSGVALTDEDRRPWLDAIVAKLDATPEPAVLACSALRQSYREQLQQSKHRLRVVFLKASKDELRRRLSSRSGHFFAPELLHSQFETLEEPKDAIVIDALLPVPEIVDRIVAGLPAT